MNRIYVVSWEYNGRKYRETFSTLLQAMVRFWKLGDNNSKAISHRG